MRTTLGDTFVAAETQPHLPPHMLEEHGLYGTITRIRNSNGEFFPPQPIAVNGGSKFVNLAHVVETWAVGE